MKKLYQSEQWKRHSAAVSRRKLRRNRLHRLRLRHHNRQKNVFKGVNESGEFFDENFSVVTPPPVFSLIKNPEEVILFMNLMHHEFRKGKNVHIDLREIQGVSCETIAWLISNISNPKFCNNKKCTGNNPANSQLLEIFKKSGFYSQVRTANTVSTDGEDKIFKRTGKKVELTYVEKMINFSTKLIYGQKTKVGGIYRALIECMANTRDHASVIGKQHIPWWTTVYYNDQEKRACFTFLDNGVGIFKSVKLKNLLKKISKVLGVHDNKRILQDILAGTVASSTGIPFRGKGLPSINKAFKRGQISRLIIITNDVYANLETGTFVTLKNSFKGTLLYWEHGKQL